MIYDDAERHFSHVLFGSHVYHTQVRSWLETDRWPLLGQLVWQGDVDIRPDNLAQFLSELEAVERVMLQAGCDPRSTEDVRSGRARAIEFFESGGPQLLLL